MNKSSNDDIFENNFQNEKQFEEVNFNEEMFQLSENEFEECIKTEKTGGQSSNENTSNFKSCLSI